MGTTRFERTVFKLARNGGLLSLLFNSLLGLPAVVSAEQVRVEKETTKVTEKKLVTVNPYSAAQPGDGLIYDASLRYRYEHGDWADNGAAGTDETFGVNSLKGQMGVGYQYEGIKAYVQGQYNQLFSLKNNWAGLGGDYFAANGSDDPNEVFIRQGYVQFANPPFSWGLTARAGRYLYNSGMEVGETGNKNIDWLKKNRIGERLIGSNDFFFGRSFDGAGFDYKFDRCIGTLSLNVLHPTQGVLHADAGPNLRDVDLITAAYTTDIKGFPGAGEFQTFYYHYDDERNPSEENVFKVDNRPEGLIAGDPENVQIQTFGAHWVQEYDTEAGVKFDSVFWGALQGGRWGVQDHHAGAFTIEGGMRLEDVVASPWIRGGWTYASGDDDANDNDHGTFFQMLPSNRNYASIPFYNMMNNQDLFMQLILEPTEEIEFQTNVHYLWLDEQSDLLYSGGGADQRRNRFGFTGLPSGGNTNIGTLVDFQLRADITENVGVSAYYGILFGDDVMNNNFGRDGDIGYAFGALNLKL